MSVIYRPDAPARGVEPPLERRYPLSMPAETSKPNAAQKPPATKDRVAIALGIRVREIRKALGRSQDDLADASGIDRRYLSRLETGDKNPTLRALARIADALGVTLSHLFKGVPGYGQPLENRPYERRADDD